MPSWLENEFCAIKPKWLFCVIKLKQFFSWSVRPLISSSTVLFFSMHHAQDAFILPPNPTPSALLSGPEPDTDGLHRPSSLLPGFQAGSANGRSGRRSEVRRKEGWRYISTIVSPLAGLNLLTMAGFHVGNSAKATALILAFPCLLCLEAVISSHTC